MTMSDRIAVMRDGIILQIGSPLEIYDHPNCRFVADFIGESNILNGTVRSADGNLLHVETADGMILTQGKDFSVGEIICVSIRPEYLSVSRTPEDGFTVKACVKDFIYMGTVIKTSLDLESGQELKFSRFEPDPDLHEGDERWLCWDPAKSVPIHLEAQEVRS